MLHVQKELSVTLAEMKSLQENHENQNLSWNKEKSEMEVGVVR